MSFMCLTFFILSHKCNKSPKTAFYSPLCCYCSVLIIILVYIRVRIARERLHAHVRERMCGHPRVSAYAYTRVHVRPVLLVRGFLESLQTILSFWGWSCSLIPSSIDPLFRISILRRQTALWRLFYSYRVIGVIPLQKNPSKTSPSVSCSSPSLTRRF